MDRLKAASELLRIMDFLLDRVIPCSLGTLRALSRRWTISFVIKRTRWLDRSHNHWRGAFLVIGRPILFSRDTTTLVGVRTMRVVRCLLVLRRRYRDWMPLSNDFSHIMWIDQTVKVKMSKRVLPQTGTLTLSILRMWTKKWGLIYLSTNLRPLYLCQKDGTLVLGFCRCRDRHLCRNACRPVVFTLWGPIWDLFLLCGRFFLL